MPAGRLILLPNLLSKEEDPKIHLPPSVSQAMAEIDGLIAESEGGGRGYLKQFQLKKPPHNTPIASLDEHSKDADLDFLLEPVLEGETWGLLSDAGLPCVADPGSRLVFRARRKGVSIEVHTGPSSVTHALMLSGLPGQRFAFQGYLSKKPEERIRELKSLERKSERERSTQIFIEAPYRNQAMIESCIQTLDPKTILSVAVNLCSSEQVVKTQPIEIWRDRPMDLPKVPAIYLIYKK